MFNNTSNNVKIPSPWAQLGLFMGLLLGAYLLYSVAAGAYIVAVTGLSNIRKGLDLSDPHILAAVKLTQGLSSVIVFGLPAFFYARQTFRQQPLQQLGFHPAQKTIFYALGVLLLLTAFPFEGWLGMLNKRLPLPASLIDLEKDNDKQVIAILQMRSPLDLYINLFIVALLPAIFEEMCFRGALQRIMIQAFKSPWAGIIFAGAFFSAFHMQFQGFLPRMMLGILLGAAYWYSGSLWTSILGHFFFNGIQVVAASYYPKLMNENPDVPAYAGLISLVIVVGLLSIMRKQSTVTYAQVYN